MAVKNTLSSYGSIAKFFHWSIAIAVILLLAVGFYMTGLPKESFRFMIYNYHKLFGLLVLTLMLARLSWKLVNIKPQLPASLSRLEQIAATASHHSFYVLLFIMPLSGWVMSTAAGYAPHIGGFKIALPGLTKNKAIAGVANNAHEIMAWIIISLITIHVLAALKHHFVDKNEVLVRMLPFTKP